MAEELLDPREAARRLGVAVPTLYDWLGRSRRGVLMIRGTPVTVAYYQTGPRGGGRIRIPAGEVLRLLDLMRVPVEPARTRRPPTRQTTYPGITVPLGRPE